MSVALTLPIDVSQDIDYVEKLCKDTPELTEAINTVVGQLKIIIAGTRELLSEDMELSSFDAAIVVRFILYVIFQNYAISTEIYKYYQDYSPVEYEQTIQKLLKQSPSVLVKFLTLAKEDTEAALDYLDGVINTVDGENNKPQGD